MKNIGQIQPAKKPAKDKINSAYQHSNPGSQMRWGEIHTSQHVAKNNHIAGDVVYFHSDLRGLFKQKWALLSNSKLSSKRLESASAVAFVLNCTLRTLEHSSTNLMAPGPDITPDKKSARRRRYQRKWTVFESAP
jgi:hypothetical protein